MMRYLILAIALYILYRIVRGVVGPGREEPNEPEGGAVEELVQDAHCKVYVPRRDSVERIIEGRSISFAARSVQGSTNWRAETQTGKVEGQ